mmetsp:Transcript_4407/g.7484  ORF Transcript_4407/g.7484 Transcript_4407/m.7484 type:complete len:411 (+) Transcript_4407:466-1698(+)
MDVPDPSKAGINPSLLKNSVVGAGQKFDPYSQQPNNLAPPSQQNQLGRDGSTNQLKRDPSENRLVQDNQLGPQIMKKKVGLQVEYKQWNQGPNMNSSQKPRIDDSSRKSRGMESAQKLGEDSEEDYEENFEEKVDDSGLDEMERLRNAMAREKAKAEKFNVKNLGKKVVEAKPAGPLNNPLKPQKNMDGFVKQKGLIMGERVDHMAVNQQIERAKELRDLIQLSHEEVFNVFELVPQTPQDAYYKRIDNGSIKTAMVSCVQEAQQEEVQAEVIETAEKTNFAPEDLYFNYSQENSQLKRRHRQNEGLNLEKFLGKAGPLMEKLIEQNQDEFFLKTRGEAKKRNAVELKNTIKFPSEILLLFAEKDAKPAEVVKVTAVHLFESSPQSLCSVAYVLRKSTGELVYVAIVYIG